ncbi:MAG: 4Fe-4S ferredoxin, partial [Bacteroidales bacterium]|nr:4Fe-4S ferredoxin [Bacteroidales bacterium]
MTSKVYFTDLRTKPGRNLLDKLEILIKKAGIEKIDLKDKFTAVKIHFGEPGNLAYIRPNYAARL